MKYQTKLTDYGLGFDNQKFKVTRKQVERESAKLESLREAIRKSLQVSPESWNIIIGANNPYSGNELNPIYR